MFTKKFGSLIFTFPMLWLTSFMSPDNASITVAVDAIESTGGRIVLMLFDQEEEFPREVNKVWKIGKVKPQGEKATYTFSEVPYGTYAIAIFHDENDDGEIETNFMGLPQKRVRLPICRAWANPVFADAE